MYNSSTATPARKYKLSEAIKKNFQKKSITSLSTCKNVHSVYYIQGIKKIALQLSKMVAAVQKGDVCSNTVY